ncbi:uncharacterized protein LOC136038876 isoform X2 [Artemia franciscana]|uniref:uncharacterized protein LOC136038876 isoform X2 n=1 Tax=Artemia franciscana TaxID=6661 RepID=UPI0032DB4518
MINQQEDCFLGDGQALYGVGSVGTLHESVDGSYRPVSDESIFENIFAAVDSASTGFSRASTLLAKVCDSDYGMDSCTSSNQRETLKNLLDPYGSDPYIDKKTFQEKASHWLTITGANELNYSQRHISISGISDEDLDGTFMHSTPTPSPRKRGRNGDDELSVFSCGSLEGTGGEVNRKSEADLLHEVTDLQFRNRRLQEEILQLKRQLVQAEDANVTAQNNYVELQKRASMLQSNLDRCKSLETEFVALRLSLSTAEENLSDANDEKRCLEKDVRLLTIEIQQAEAKIQKVEEELLLAQNENEDLTSLLMKEQSEVCRMKQQLEDLEAALAYEREQKNESRQSLEEITRMLQIVQAEKNDLEAQLSRLLDEHPSLRMAASNTSFYLEHEMALRKFVPATSTPFRWNDGNETLLEELKRLGVDCESEGPWSLPIFSREEDDPPPALIYSQDSFGLQNTDIKMDSSGFLNLDDKIDTSAEILRGAMFGSEPRQSDGTYIISDCSPSFSSSEFASQGEAHESFQAPALNKIRSLPTNSGGVSGQPVKWKSADNLLEEKKNGLLLKTAKFKKLREKQEKKLKAEGEKIQMLKPVFRLESSNRKPSSKVSNNNLTCDPLKPVFSFFKLYSLN